MFVDLRLRLRVDGSTGMVVPFLASNAKSKTTGWASCFQVIFKCPVDTKPSIRDRKQVSTNASSHSSSYSASSWQKHFTTFEFLTLITERLRRVLILPSTTKACLSPSGSPTRTTIAMIAFRDGIPRFRLMLDDTLQLLSLRIADSTIDVEWIKTADHRASLCNTSKSRIGQRCFITIGPSRKSLSLQSSNNVRQKSSANIEISRNSLHWNQNSVQFFGLAIFAEFQMRNSRVAPNVIICLTKRSGLSLNRSRSVHRFAQYSFRFIKATEGGMSQRDLRLTSRAYPPDCRTLSGGCIIVLVCQFQRHSWKISWSPFALGLVGLCHHLDTGPRI